MLLLALLSLIALLSACGDGAPEQGGASTVQLTTTLLSAPVDSMHVYDSTFVRTSTAFAKHFRLAGGDAIRQVEQEMRWEDLETWMARWTGQRALRFEYGLRNDSFVVALVPLELDSTPTPGTFTYQLPDSVYALEHGTLDPVPGATWRKARQYNVDDSTVYFARVVRDDPAGVPKALDHGTDAHADVMAWDEELQLLYDENKTGHGDSTFHAVFHCISEPNGAGILQHRICVVLRLRPKTGSGQRDLLDNSFDKDHLFRMHGADYGNLDPPGHGVYALPPR